MANLLSPVGKLLAEHPVFQNADIVHYHLIHNQILSLLDLPALISRKPSIWTIHDPWLVTGHCVHPCDCKRWQDGCDPCCNLRDANFPLQHDNAHAMWKIKKAVYREMDIDLVVASKFMENYIRNSPLTAHFKRIHRIPFGIEIDRFSQSERNEVRDRWRIPYDNFVIGFRNEANEIKGTRYIEEMLDKLTSDIPITVLTLGTGKLPIEYTSKYQVLELGWTNDFPTLVDFYTACDVFLMPSLAESFGLMAIEAMASGCPIIVFEDTVLYDITFAPECGIGVPYKDSDKLKLAVERLIQSPPERQRRGEMGKRIVKEHYRYKDYVNRHIELYREVMERRQKPEKAYRYANQRLQETEVPQKMTEQLLQLEQQIKELSGGKAENLCVFGAGEYGIQLYQELRSRMVTVHCFADNNPDKWGYLFDSVNCISPQNLLERKETILIIVAIQNPQSVVEQLRSAGFPFITTKQTLDEILLAVPPIKWITGLEDIEGIDYSSKESVVLIQKFNRIIFEICKYYESRMPAK